MTGNVYDDPKFFAGYAALPRSASGLDGAPEWPALRAMLPDLGGRAILDLGCGYGWFACFAARAGAARVLALDASARMLARAVEINAHPAIEYRQADLETVTFVPAAFDLAYSSLAFHYVSDLAGLLARVRCALRPGGALVFSVEHPIYSAPSAPAWREGDDGRRFWPLDRYLVEGPREVAWLGARVAKQHRLMSTTLNALAGAGFALGHVEEWRPTDAQ
ncbi:MAG: class I SAM-dependent methyltransferase, partial [Rhodospirillales bacterium]